jgi:formiminoglutamase
MYIPANKKLWIGRTDENEGQLGLRWHQIIKFIDLKNERLPELDKPMIGIVMLGFRCDEGVRRNKGRVGAKEGPELMRKVCSNLANHFDTDTLVIDAGDVVCEDENLEGAQEELQELVASVRSKGYFIFIFGGGHEVAYPHFMGIRKSIPDDKTIGIVNIDAHFDLRLPEDKASSGTPFFQISEFCQANSQQFRYMAIGIQRSANTQALFARAAELGVTHIPSSDLRERNMDLVRQQIEDFIGQVDIVYLTVCLDVFDISFAPGVSAPSAIGIHPAMALELISMIGASGKLISADIAELNPSVDQGDKTSKLASKLTFEIITSYLSGGRP